MLCKLAVNCEGKGSLVGLPGWGHISSLICSHNLNIQYSSWDTGLQALFTFLRYSHEDRRVYKHKLCKLIKLGAMKDHNKCPK